MGAENIPSGPHASPHVVMSKHSSTWETLALIVFFPPLAFVAKKELLSIPFFGWAFALASPITIDRKAGTGAMEQIITQGRERLRQGFARERLQPRPRPRSWRSMALVSSRHFWAISPRSAKRPEWESFGSADRDHQATDGNRRSGHTHPLGF